MIWIDIATPKYALFFTYMMPYLKDIDDEVLITTRQSDNYNEVTKVLELNKIDFQILGNYGGSTIKEKFNARLKRQAEFVEIFEKRGYPKVLICGSSVEGVQTAFSLAIPVIHFADTPIKGYSFKYEDITILSKLTIPLSSLIFHPFVIPSDVFVKIGANPKNVISHDFIDICLWMDKIKKKKENDFRIRYGLDPNKKTILIREEEYKAHYVKEQLPIIYNLIPKIAKEMNCNIVIMPRYESDYLHANFKDYALILEDKLRPEEFYPFIDFLVGGGGTMNLEASYFGIPVLSTRSLWLYHDKYLIDNALMFWSDNEEESLSIIKDNIGKMYDNKSYFCKNKCSFEKITLQIKQYLEQRK